MTQNGINEQALIDNLVNNSVTTMQVVQGEDGKFRIYVTLTWKEGQQLLETQRKTARAWASLDRLTRHINQKYRNAPVIELKLRGEDERIQRDRN